MIKHKRVLKRYFSLPSRKEEENNERRRKVDRELTNDTIGIHVHVDENGRFYIFISSLDH